MFPTSSHCVMLCGSEKLANGGWAPQVLGRWAMNAGGFTGRSAYSWVVKVVGRAGVGAQEAGRIECFVFFVSGFFLKIAGRSASCVAVRRVSSWMCVAVLLRFFLDVRGIVAALLPWCAVCRASSFRIDNTPRYRQDPYLHLRIRSPKKMKWKQIGMMSHNNERMCGEKYCVWETRLLLSS